MDNSGYLSRRKCRVYTETGIEERTAHLTAECSLYLTVNGKQVWQTVCSPVSPEELVMGYLVTSGQIRSPSSVTAVSCEQGETEIRVSVTLAPLPEEKKTPVPEWDREQIRKLYDYGANGRAAHGTHSCTLMTGGEILCRREDVSRHNAIDRAVGCACIRGADLSRSIAFFSGRVSGTAVEKIAGAGIPVLCSKAMPTARAADLAAEKGIVLLFCGGEIIQF